MARGSLVPALFIIRVAYSHQVGESSEKDHFFANCFNPCFWCYWLLHRGFAPSVFNLFLRNLKQTSRDQRATSRSNGAFSARKNFLPDYGNNRPKADSLLHKRKNNSVGTEGIACKWQTYFTGPTGRSRKPFWALVEGDEHYPKRRRGIESPSGFVYRQRSSTKSARQRSWPWGLIVGSDDFDWLIRLTISG